MTEEEQIGEEAFELHRKILALEARRRAELIESMALVIKMQDNRLFCAVLGDDNADWPAYLAQIGVFYSRSKVRRWKRILEFLENSGLTTDIVFDIPESRLEQIALVRNAFKTKEDVLEILEQARVLIPRDWKNTILSLRGKPTLDDCKHENKLYEICSNCGDKHLKKDEKQL